MKMREDWLE
jgi:hypothetical protein